MYLSLYQYILNFVGKFVNNLCEVSIALINTIEYPTDNA